MQVMKVKGHAHLSGSLPSTPVDDVEVDEGVEGKMQVMKVKGHAHLSGCLPSTPVDDVEVDEGIEARCRS